MACQTVFSVETINAAYESFDGINSKQDDKTSTATSSQGPIYAMPTKLKQADNVGDLYASVDKKTKKGNLQLKF